MSKSNAPRRLPSRCLMISSTGVGARSLPSGTAVPGSRSYCRRRILVFAATGERATPSHRNPPDAWDTRHRILGNRAESVSTSTNSESIFAILVSFAYKEVERTLSLPSVLGNKLHSEASSRYRASQVP